MEPLILTRSATVKETIQSLDSNIPAIDIKTTEPVIIEGDIVSAGVLIKCSVPGANVTIRNTKGKGITPTIDGLPYGRFFYGENLKSLVIENCEFEHTAGIKLLGGSPELLKIRFNKVKNIDGRTRAGVKSKTNVCFVQLDKVFDIRNGEIAWNYVKNEYGNSRVEDNINIYVSSGTKESPLLIRHNLIDGAYPLPGEGNGVFTGSGVMMDRTYHLDTKRASAFVKAYENYIIRTVNCGMGISGGNNNEFFKNVIVSSNTLPDGTKLWGKGNNGIHVYNMDGPEGDAPPDIYFNNSAHDNYTSYINQSTGKLQNFWSPGADCTNCVNNTAPEAPTRELEDKKVSEWFNLVEQQGIKLGVLAKGYTLEELIKISGVQASSPEEIISKVEARGKEIGRIEREEELKAIQLKNLGYIK